ncbi:MAG: acyl-CoA synthetase FdrA [Firmicutes bacterium]|nr:acyl-CoA synthetase FdrA [Bacillota bacterium]
MIIRNVVRKNFYNDSVSLMLLSSKIGKMAGVKEAAVMMATAHNIEIMERSGLLLPDSKGASPNDMLIAVLAEDEESSAAALEAVDEYFAGGGQGVQAGDELVAKSQTTALGMLPGANLSLISVPGPYAAAEAKKALNNKLHVFLFSDNVTLQEEKELKDIAAAKGLLMMGPDCGTAIINGVGLGFANAVPKGPIGLVAAAGTGLQEVACLITELGGGISQALGTGGRDIKNAIGGTTMLMGLAALARDPATKVIVLVAKPPEENVLGKLNVALQSVNKPVVTCFLGAKGELAGEGVYPVGNLQEAALKAVELSALGADSGADFIISASNVKEIAAAEATCLRTPQRYLRGLYSGGTLCYEALLLVKPHIGNAYSNVSLEPHFLLASPDESKEHTLLDMGDDYFTAGRPHPMIDPSLRVERIRREAADPETAVILLDLVLGHGSHRDPAGALLPAIREGKREATAAGRHLSVVASVCGTSSDPQGLVEQEEKLRTAGVIVMPSNAQAVAMAAAILTSHNKI